MKIINYTNVTTNMTSNNIDPREEYNRKWKFFHYVSGLAMKVFVKFKYGQGVDVYIPMIMYLLRKDGIKVERNAMLPIFWDNESIGESCCVDMLIHDKVMVKVISQNDVETKDREPFKNRMHLTHSKYGMIINFSPDKVYSEWYYRDPAYVGRNSVSSIGQNQSLTSLLI